MQLIYIHGLNSDASSEKGEWLEEWCKKNAPYIKVRRPDLNLPPKEALQKLLEIIQKDPMTGLVASSLGGFYATICVEKAQCKGVLLNPSMYPYRNMLRYFKPEDSPKTVGHSTQGGWQIQRSHLDDLKIIAPQKIFIPQNILVLLKRGDETLDYRIAENYFSEENRQVAMMIENEGNHYYSDLRMKIPVIMQFLFHVK